MAWHCNCATSRSTGKTTAHFTALAIFTNFVYACLFFPWGSEAGLYTASDQIIVLTPENVDSVLVNSTAAVVVEFYASWCGHCIAFTPIYRSLARDIKEWKLAVDLAAIDCAVEENRKVCTRFGIKGYPSLKFFHAYSKSDTKGQAFRGFPREVRGLRQNIIDQMETHQEAWPPACPPLEPASPAEIDSFFETNSVDHLALVFENLNSYVGREVILDLLQYENIAVRRVLSSEKDLASKLGVSDFPSCYLLSPSGNYTRLKVQNEARAFYSYALQRLPGVVRSGKPRPATSDLTNTTEEQWRPFNRSRVYMADLESALHYSLRVELSSHPVIKGEDLSALKRYVSVLAQFFPGRPMVQRQLKSVDSWLLSHGEAELHYSALIGQLDNIDQIPGAALPVGVNWVGCQGSKPHFRRFPCGMWTLFHVLTVQAKNTADSDPQEVLQAMRGYVQSFFGCRECAEHFANMAEESLAQVSSLSTAVLWLWSRHNRVNNRVAGALSEDPHFPKVQWPPPDQCPQCHSVQAGGEHSWNQQKVLSFLSTHFSSRNILNDYLTEESLVLSRQRERLEAQRLEREAQSRAERKAREALTSMTQLAPPQHNQEEEEEEEEEEGAQDEPVVAEEEAMIEDEKEGIRRRLSEPRPAQRRPSIMGKRLREPQEDIVDLDSFVKQHYKVKALQDAASSRRRKRSSLEKREGLAGLRGGALGLGAELEEAHVGERKRLHKRGLTAQHFGGAEEDDLGLQFHPQPQRGRQWMSMLNVGFSSLDVSLCVILYFLSSMCLLAMYLYFKNRLRCRAKVSLP
ncbi:sulfhydryl oxidase 1 [Aplochiton taeniatus]